MIRPAMAIFKPEKKEFFLTLEDALAYDDPFDAVHQFLQSGFDIMQKYIHGNIWTGLRHH